MSTNTTYVIQSKRRDYWRFFDRYENLDLAIEDVEGLRGEFRYNGIEFRIVKNVESTEVLDV